MDEVYTPVEQTAGPSLGGALSRSVGSVMFERSSTVHRTMRYGSSANTNWANTWLGWKHTVDEMDRFTDKTYGTNWRRYSPFSGNMLGSAWAPSSWMIAADLVENPQLGSPNLLNVARGKRWSTSGAPVYDDVASLYGHSTARNFPLANGNNPARERLTRTTANKVINSFLKGGKNYKPNFFLDVGWGAWFRPGEKAASIVSGSRMGPLAANEMWAFNPSKYGWINSLKGLQQTGQSMRMIGGKAVAGTTKFASLARGAFVIGGTALKAYNWATLGYMGGKAAYKGWELFNIKAPVAAYKAVGRQLGRPAFSSGDASLLTGIPANNRMRAVQAIQGSRLNARSALGNEASLLSGHFG